MRNPFGKPDFGRYLTTHKLIAIHNPGSFRMVSPTSPPAFLASLVPPPSQEPHITLTWAQSIDACIAAKGGGMLPLSGVESMLMTHWLRTMHAGIMVGVGTVLNDNPRLNVRLLHPQSHHLTPRPIILDPYLRTPPSARLLTTLLDPETPHAKAPIFLCAARSSEVAARREALEKAGGKVHEVDMPGGRLDFATLPSILINLNIPSLMIEGGANLLSQLIGSPVVGLKVVTVAPVFVPGGVRYTGAAAMGGEGEFVHVYTEKMGKDTVVVLKRS